MERFYSTHKHSRKNLSNDFITKKKERKMFNRFRDSTTTKTYVCVCARWNLIVPEMRNNGNFSSSSFYISSFIIICFFD